MNTDPATPTADLEVLPAQTSVADINGATHAQAEELRHEHNRQD